MKSVYQPTPQPTVEYEVTLDGTAETKAWAARWGHELRAGDVVLLTGELGAGKTTFTQGLGAGLGVREGIISPTFVLSRIHPSRRGGVDLVHVDAYRLTSADELADMDLEATLDRSVTVIEWGRGLAESLAGWPDDSEASWLDIELVRSNGSGVTGDEGLRADAEAGTIVTDFSDDDGTGHDEIRTAIVRAFGPRWRNAALPR